ncbi:hypothetical protein [Nocardia sp. alder85J]|uniref:hypothetical protein n=1 Tax=Nocardia sp. alder85J TaxID=2862949 RepID=UPI001CD43B80|nr:hypothetical protein [Nocardia sp. alder85J]MCX4095313.1 hypothetical protein [Nocardia sp. alder85J]
MTEALANDAETDPELVARKAMRAYLEALRDEPLRVRLAYVEVVGVSDRVEAHREHTREQWAEVIAGIAARLGGARPLSPEQQQLAAAAFIGAVNGLVHRWSLHQPGHPVDELAETLANILIALYTVP